MAFVCRVRRWRGLHQLVLNEFLQSTLKIAAILARCRHVQSVGGVEDLHVARRIEAPVSDISGDQAAGDERVQRE